MISKAKELAEQEGVLERITFVEGALEDLSAFVQSKVFNRIRFVADTPFHKRIITVLIQDKLVFLDRVGQVRSLVAKVIHG